MYLEISPRRSGKTMRLVKQANLIHNEGVKVIIVVPDIGFSKIFSNMGLNPKIEILNGKNPLPTRILSDNENYILYDEFDYCNYVSIRDTNAYYVTTPCGRWCSILSKHNKDQYMRYTTTSVDTLGEMYSILSKQAWETEYECKF